MKKYSPNSKEKSRITEGKRLFVTRSVFLLFSLSAMFSNSCTFYNDSHSGTYREVIQSENATGPAYVLVIFRFGYFVQAIIRRYDFTPPNGKKDRFVQDTFCTWTASGKLGKDETFRLSIPKRGREAFVIGEFIGKDELKASIYNLNKNGEILTLDMSLERNKDTSEECRDEQYLAISAYLPPQSLSALTIPKESAHPEFTILWLGVELESTEGVQVYTATRQLSLEAVSLDGILDIKAKSIKSAQYLKRMNWPPPPGVNTYTTSGTTYFSLGLPVVIKSSSATEKFTEWNPKEEPIIATSLKNEKNKDIKFNHNGYGRGILYVEGSLDSLSGSVKNRMSYLNNGRRDPVLTIPNKVAHLYLCDFYYNNDTIIHIDLRDSSELASIPLWITDKWAESQLNKLPIFYPN